MSKLVMVIDDSPTIRKIIEVSLGREGMEVVSYPDGIQALQAVAAGQLEQLPDLLLLDLALPHMNGFEVARHLRSKSEWNQTMIVILSRQNSVVDRLKARLVGTQAYLSKPLNTRVLLDVVKTCLGLPASSM